MATRRSSRNAVKVGSAAVEPVLTTDSPPTNSQAEHVGETPSAATKPGPKKSATKRKSTTLLETLDALAITETPDVVGDAAPKSKKQRNGDPDPIARDPLPARKNRVVNPGAPDKPRGRRSTAEVAADEAAEEELDRLMADIAKKKRQLAARFDMDQEAEDAEYRMNQINRVSDVEEEVRPEHVDDRQDEDADEVEVIVAGGKKRKPVSDILTETLSLNNNSPQAF